MWMWSMKKFVEFQISNWIFLHLWTSCLPGQLVQTLTLLTCIWEVPGSYLRWYTYDLVFILSPDRAIAHVVCDCLPTSTSWVRFQVSSCGIYGDKVELGEVYSEYFSFSCQFSLHHPLHVHYLSYCNGFDQRVPRQQLFKPGPTLNDKKLWFL
jgi:hypothetical protein